MIGHSELLVSIVKSRIVRIGNSQGLRIPRTLLEQAGLSAEVSLHVTEEGLLITPVPQARVGWADAATALQRDEAATEDPFITTDFDEGDWEW